MQIQHLQQGTQAWSELRASKCTASEAAAMMGDSKHQSREALLKQKATGEQREINRYQASIFAKGHEAEAKARPLVEDMIGEELYPVTALSDDYDWMLASFDGITLLEDVIFEHKLYNQTLFHQVLNNELEPHYYWQLEQQLLVSNADKVIFVCSNGTAELFASCEYVSHPERRARLLAGWQRFRQDLADYQPQPDPVTLEANPVRALPALTYRMEGLTLHSNLDVFKQAVTQLVTDSQRPIQTDQDFADAEVLVKVFKDAESKLKHLSEQVQGEVHSIDHFIKDLTFISEQIRQARLTTDKQVKQRKEEIKQEIAQKAKRAITQHSEALKQRIQAELPPPTTSVLMAMKGKKSVHSLEAAAETAVSQIIIELDLHAAKADANLAYLSQQPNYQFLFPDWANICFKAEEDFKALAEQRITAHQAREQQQQQQQDQSRQEPTNHAESKSSATNIYPIVKIPSSDAAKQMVHMTAQEAIYLRKRDTMLTALEQAGVSSWRGYKAVMASLKSSTTEGKKTTLARNA
ncbi:TPA: lambda-exonuclease family protein [Photobacterium damselae]